jgi:hypothetical protein
VPVWSVAGGLGWDDFRLRSPLGQYFLAAHDDGIPPPPAGVLETRFEPVSAGRFFGDLGLFAYHNLGAGRLSVRLERDVRLFDEAAVARLRDALDALLTRVTARPVARLSALLADVSWLDHE